MNKGKIWSRIKKIDYDGELMPKYSYIVDNMCYVFINEKIFIIKLKSDFEDDL